MSLPMPIQSCSDRQVQFSELNQRNKMNTFRKTAIGVGRLYLVGDGGLDDRKGLQHLGYHL
jgi:hypothetical protein